MAQLCVLREDLYLELEGLSEDEIDSLDHNGDNYRSTYFFRNSTRTLFEIRKAVQSLKGQAVFMKLELPPFSGHRLRLTTCAVQIPQG